MSSPERKRPLPFPVSEKLLERLERYAASSGTTPRALVEGLLAGFLDEMEKLRRVN